MSPFFRILVVAMILLPTAVFAAADDWRVVKTTDQVKYTVDRTNWQDLRAGEVVPNRAWVSTGPRGRVQLARGVESVTFQPNTLAAITTDESAAMKTQIYQQLGSLDIEIEKRSQPHAAVQTPYLAAVVKGTIFHVTVDKTRASVSVDRGLVQVTSFASGQRSNVAPGQSATVDKKAGMTVRGRLSKPEIMSVAPSVAQIPAVGAAKLAGATEAAETKSSSSATGKNTSSSASDDDDESGSKGNGNSGNRNDGNGNGHSDHSSNSGKGSGNGTDGSKGNSGGSGNNGNSDGNSNGNSGKGDKNSGGSGKGNSGENGKGKDK
ncbi:FecR domain-containing protein [Rhizobium binae]|uniref:FecR domain-containing protein n=1 Tax=Rhizobium binae TaxID=1138190 RepID=UPI001C82DC94|nr:FecR domain-containing protein [Rhizobium binae]MBX4926475.1 hypothetical protein [Rhizobium binae]MBX4936613.1 hypothetical protein [Rhizobium binae]MBX4942937.1 hypothetical protein [Rhizobium binae]MBX4978544.1 hypothetical protein [Rhizobium binae]